jgi:hypothetical protein
MTYRLIPISDHVANTDPTASFVTSGNRKGAAIYSTRQGNVVCFRGQAVEGFLPTLDAAREVMEEIFQGETP